MQFFQTLAVLASASLALAQQRPMNTSICDYYTTALLKENSPANQYKVLQLVVNGAIIGNYTMPNTGVMVPGILAPGMYNGQKVSLAPYFNGALASSNRNGKAVSVNFLDGGGPTPLTKNQLPMQGSNQARLVTHLYQYFGDLLGCTGYGKMGFPAYNGSGNQYEVHRFMDLGPAEVGYFIQQVGLSAQSYGVSMNDVKTVGDSLNKVFGYKCSPPAAVIPGQGNQTQSICSADQCPLDPHANCGAYPAGGAAAMRPMNTTGGASAAMNGTSGGSAPGSGSGSSGSGSSSMTPSGSPAMKTGAANANAAGMGAAAVAAAAFAFAL